MIESIKDIIPPGNAGECLMTSEGNFFWMKREHYEEMDALIKDATKKIREKYLSEKGYIK